MSHRIDEGNCIGCSACYSLCPVFAISGEKNELYQINEKRCVDCGVCARVCPKGAIKDANNHVPERIKRESWPNPEIDSRLCSACGMCVNWCTPKAITITMPDYQGDIAVYASLTDKKRCVGCGLCEKHCPLDVIRMV